MREVKRKMEKERGRITERDSKKIETEKQKNTIKIRIYRSGPNAQRLEVRNRHRPNCRRKENGKFSAVNEDLLLFASVNDCIS